MLSREALGFQVLWTVKWKAYFLCGSKSVCCKDNQLLFAPFFVFWFALTYKENIVMQDEQFSNSISLISAVRKQNALREVKVSLTSKGELPP